MPAPSPLLFSASQAEPVVLSGQGFPLGVLPNAVYDTQYTPFIPGDLLLLCSDGVTEARNVGGEFLSEQYIKEAVTAALQNSPPNPALQSVEALKRLLRAHSPGPVSDDVTVNAYWRCGKAG